jgi:hypothetical protein
MPPKSVAKEFDARWFNRLLKRRASFHFYPQCTPCSNKQGSLLSAATNKQSSQSLHEAGGGKLAYNHAWRPRWGHLAGGVVAGLTVVGATNADIQDGNAKRFHDIEGQVRNWVYQLYWRFGH